ncbi:tat (twin-arginine translocation) pathway signal sequence domain protein [Chrysochromulina tobinii]|uniref:Tat (Twin-arginine translocation) pathway signal sequence domain protein n=1 Tax=Chrysochromulina tobinii TaxID=1460289 RepID=A0A0M0JK03_9EUKA|nr:tat (twin-arginine translocation) pathway signal sequence domain protein [Chrysochromulina tobinii]|eukprot:KOO26820.1 tat (twin-arginine translocation) pathway signal sequence domain protein [Chrysochromulina sp. CCMP291]
MKGVQSVGVTVLTLLSHTREAAAAACPASTTQVDTFSVEGKSWLACEDLAVPGGTLALVPTDDEDGAETVYLPKTYEPYSPEPDESYYLGLGKKTVLAAKWDMLGDAIVNQCETKTPTTGLCEPTWSRVERAVPVMRYSQGNKDATGNEFMCSPYEEESGVRTFTGSRSASVDATFSDHADDCTDNGFPRPQGYVMNLTAIANGEPPIQIDGWKKYVNFSGMAEGLVGLPSPNLVFYFPLLTQNFSTWGGSRYWTMIASPVPDMQGGREQSVWFRFQQLKCAGPAMAPPCALHGKPQYYDTYWYSYSPITSRWIRPELMANASGFYANILAVQRYWEAELAAEGMMALELPETPTTNGTWLEQQSVFAFVRSMISRDDTWHPRYGVLPGYGITLQDGFQDTFTSTATAALEWGAFPYARGVIDNWLRYYVRDNGMVTYRAEELAQSGRMLTIFALYVDSTGDRELMLTHFGKVRALAQWLLYRYQQSLADHPDPADPAHGILGGGDEGDGFVSIYETYGKQELPHYYSTTANAVRGFEDAGLMWRTIGQATGRLDVMDHADELLTAAPQARAKLLASIAKKIYVTGNPRAPRCVPTIADPPTPDDYGMPGGCLGDFRGYPELMYSGLLSKTQTDDLFTYLTYGNNTHLVVRPLTLGAAGYNSKQTTYTAYGMAYGLLCQDMIERFLLHWFGMSAHTYTRGTFTTPEASHPDRDVGSTDYVAAGVVTAPTYLKWALLFEDPNTRCVWVAKALPPAGSAPPGGVRLRMRTPVEFAGKLAAVTVGGKPWTSFDAREETIVLSLADLTPQLLTELRSVVATFR